MDSQSSSARLVVGGADYGTTEFHVSGSRDSIIARNGQGSSNKRRVWKLVLGIVFLTIAAYFSCVLQVLVEKRAAERFSVIPDKYNMTKADRDKLLTLPDIGFDIVPFHGFSIVSDYWVLMMTVTTLIRFSLTSMRATILRRWAILVGLLFLLRGICIYVTILPTPDHSCKSEVDTDQVFYSALLALFLQTRTCADVLFSGHSVNGTICALLWAEYSDVVPLNGPRKLSAVYGTRRWCSIPKFFIWLCCISGYVLIIATHFHYTIDVFFAICLSLLIWKLYHNFVFVKVAPMQLLSSDAERAKLSWMKRLVFFLEGDAEDVEYFLMLDVRNCTSCGGRYDESLGSSDEVVANESSPLWNSASRQRVSPQSSSRRSTDLGEELTAALLDSPPPPAYQSFADL